MGQTAIIFMLAWFSKVDKWTKPVCNHRHIGICNHSWSYLTWKQLYLQNTTAPSLRSGPCQSCAGAAGMECQDKCWRQSDQDTSHEGITNFITFTPVYQTNVIWLQGNNITFYICLKSWLTGYEVFALYQGVDKGIMMLFFFSLFCKGISITWSHAWKLLSYTSLLFSQQVKLRFFYYYITILWWPRLSKSLFG